MCQFCRMCLRSQAYLEGPSKLYTSLKKWATDYLNPTHRQDATRRLCDLFLVSCKLQPSGTIKNRNDAFAKKSSISRRPFPTALSTMANELLELSTNS
ncbi:hypothetical protein BGX33_009868 [Mortierella sp. NVP41]|nr:hypothetical protein BGX33_009868 [Mortierella sp. NVP41]